MAAYREVQSQPRFMQATTSYSKHGAQPASLSPPSTPSGTVSHTKPFVVSAAGGAGRAKNFKGTFSPFTYESGGPQPLSSDNSLSAHRWRSVDHRGAPSNVHRGVTSLRAKTNEQGIPGCTVPIANRTLAHDKDLTWHPSPFVDGGMRIGDNYRTRAEGLEGVKRRQSKVQQLHGGSFTLGANVYHSLFDPAVRSNARDFSQTAVIAGEAQAARNKVKHQTPFRGSSNSYSSVGENRGFIGGHSQFPYHFSEYGLSEKSLSDTKIANGIGTGFRQQCAHHIHFPLKSPTHRVSMPCETDRNPNFHAVQDEARGCHHRCNETIALAKSIRAGTAPLQPAFTTRF